MDMQPEPTQERDADLLYITNVKRLGKHVRQLESHLHSHWFDDVKTNKLLKKVRNDIGKVAIDKKSSLLAVGYTYDASGYIDPTPIVIDSTEAHFKGVAIHVVDGNDRVMFDYESDDTGDDTSTWLYSVPPMAILRAELDSSQNHRVFEYIANSRTLAAKMFQSTDFFKLNPEQQHTLLRKDVAEEMVADFGAEYDDETSVQISCRRYYQLQYSDTKPINWQDHLNQDGVLDGVIVHSVYLESLQDGLVHLASKQDFIYGQGLPCLVLANDEQETISFIPATDITAFYSPSDM